MLWTLVATYVVVDLLRHGDAASVLLGLSLVLGVSVLVYVAAWRPAVVIDDGGILLRNVLRDIYAPWSQVEDVDRSWVLTVHAGGRRYVAWAVSARNPMREGRGAHGESGVMSGLAAGFASRALRDMSAEAAKAPSASVGPGEASERVLERWMQWRHRVPDGPVQVTYRWPLAGLLLLAVVGAVLGALLAN